MDINFEFLDPFVVHARVHLLHASMVSNYSSLAYTFPMHRRQVLAERNPNSKLVNEAISCWP